MFFTTFKFAIEQQDPIWDSLSLTKQDDDYLLEIESFHTPSAEKSLNVSNDEVASFFAEVEKLGVLSWYHRWDNSIYGENQWSLTIDDEEYYGSNWYPEDFDKVVELLVAHFGFPEQKLHPAVSFPGSIELVHIVLLFRTRLHKLFQNMDLLLLKLHRMILTLMNLLCIWER